MQEMVAGDVLELVVWEQHVLLENVDMEVPEVTAEILVTIVQVWDITVMLIDTRVLWPPIARKLVINAKNGIFNS